MTTDAVPQQSGELKALEDRPSHRSKRGVGIVTWPAALAMLVALCAQNSAGSKQEREAGDAESFQASESFPGSELDLVFPVDHSFDKTPTSSLWKIVCEFEDPPIGWDQLLAEAREFVKTFPENEFSNQAREMIEVRENMVNEDGEHAKKPNKRPEDMTTQERVAELIFQLRDHTGRHGWVMGSRDIFAEPDNLNGLDSTKAPKVANPATQLVQIGYDALDQLIDVADDKRFTRCVDHNYRFHEWHRVVRVGECAMAIIQRISPTGRQFDLERDPETAKKSMKAWHLNKPAVQPATTGGG